jgi:ribonuclease P/MRP protein subunit RPP40
VPGARAPARRGGRLGAACARYGALLRLTGARFAPGTRQYERVTACARDAAAPHPFRLLLARTLGGCSARVAFPPSAAAVTHAMRPDTRRITRLTLPPLGAAFGGDAESAAAAAADATLLSALHAWLGAVACGAAGTVATAAVPWRHEPTSAAGGDGADTEEDAAADAAAAASSSSSAGYEWPLQAPWAGERGGWAEAHRWRGLLTPALVAGAVRTAASAIASGAAPWAAVSVWGFADSPVAWLPPPEAAASAAAAGGVAQEQGALPPLSPRAPGDNDYVLLLLPHARWLLLTMDTSEPL